MKQMINISVDDLPVGCLIMITNVMSDDGLDDRIMKDERGCSAADATINRLSLFLQH